jgi:hypothetical protein
MAAVAPRLPEIDAYLDASGGEALPPAALRLQQLAEVAAEIRARDV